MKARVKPVKKRPLRVTVGDQIAAGTAAISVWAEKGERAEYDNPVISAMSVALLHNILKAGPGDRDALALAVGYAMMASYKYGQYSAMKRLGAENGDSKVVDDHGQDSIPEQT